MIPEIIEGSPMLSLKYLLLLDWTGLLQVKVFTVKQKFGKLPDRTQLTLYFRIKPDLNPADSYPDLYGGLYNYNI